MLALGQVTFYDFRLQTFAQVQQMLLKFIESKETMLPNGNFEKMYQYIESIYRVSNENIANKSLLALNQSLISFLDADLMEIVLNDPKDEELKEGLALELALVSAGLGLTEVVKPYTVEEMQEVLKGQGSYYDDVTFVYSLRQMFEGNVTGNIFSSILKTIPPVFPEGDNQLPYYWDGAFILGMMLHVLWRHLFLLSQNEQAFLYQNYFYKSVVVGVPIRMAVQEVLARSAMKGETEKVFRFIVESLYSSKEIVPVDTASKTGKPFSQMIKDFTALSSSEQINTLVLEKYLSDTYRAQEYNEYFKEWLRESLNIVSRLRNRDITRI